MIKAKEIFCLNELGKRANNEDCVAPAKGTATPNDRLFIVCDGVGGEKKGELASAIACQSIREYIHKHPAQHGREKELVQNAVRYANERLAVRAKEEPEAKRMSTTLALLLLNSDSALAAWCGDTRIHHVRSGKVLWKSKDHSIVGELVSQGELTEEEARTHPQRNIITRSLNGLNFNNTVDFHEIQNVESGDYFLLCSDGLLEQMNDRLIGEILADDSLQDKGQEILTHCEGVTRDNFSMYLVQAEQVEEKRQRRFVAWGLLLILLLIAAAILATVYFRKE